MTERERESVCVCVCFLACTSCGISSLAGISWLVNSQSVMVEVPLKINRLKSGVITQVKPKYDAGFNIWNWVCQLPSFSSLINLAALTNN